MKRLVIMLAAAAFLLPAAASWAQSTNKGIIGSPHDFSTATWNIGSSGANAGRRGVCSPCHAAHHTATSQIAPLWIHETTTTTFTPYGAGPNYSGKMTVLPGQPSGPSLACLSCHDGSVAINQKISGTTINSPTVTGGVFIDPSKEIGHSGELYTTHPVSFVYDAALAAANGFLENPDTYAIGDNKASLTNTTPPVPTSWSGIPLTGKTIKSAMLFGGKMECSSCHDVHKLAGSAPSSGILLRISGNDVNNRASLICRTCHVK